MRRHPSFPNDLIAELEEQRTNTEAVDLLVKILADLDPVDFTLREIRENFNAVVSTGGDVVPFNFSRFHLKYLLDAGLIERDTKGRYKVTVSGEFAAESSLIRENGIIF